MTEACYFCNGPVNPYDQSTHKQITAWVHGKKAHGATLKEETGRYAHEACIFKAKAGQPAEQEELF